MLVFVFFPQIIDGTNPDATDQSLNVIVNGTASFGAITSSTIDNALTKPVAMVNTCVPPSMFDFESTDAKINVSGSITVNWLVVHASCCLVDPTVSFRLVLIICLMPTRMRQHLM